MAQKTSYRAESAVLLRGAVGTSGAQKLVTRPTGRPEGGTTATRGAQRAEGVELGKPDVQWPAGFSVFSVPPQPAIESLRFGKRLETTDFHTAA